MAFTKRLICAGVAAALAPGLAFSQALEEVVVTAQHRQENLQSIPVTVSALSSAQLEAAGIFDPASVAINVPGMAYAEFAPGQALISMRGISSVDDGAGLDNSVSLFLDGVYIGRLASINFDMFDLERIEVLRGPQGTLFGRNSIGGAINVISSKPADEFGGKFGITAGNEGILRYQGFVTGPLSDTVSGKFTINHRERDGFVRNVILNKDQQDEDQTSLRGQLRWTGDNSEWLLSADWMEDDREDMGRTPIENGAPVVQIAAANGVTGPRQNAAPADGFSKREASGISLQGDIDFASGTLTSITAIRQAETDWEMASVGAPLGVLGLPFDEVIDDIIEDIDTFSQEFRWNSNLGGAFNYTAGFYFLTEDTDRTEQFKITAAGTADPDVPFRQLAPGAQNVIGNEISGTFNETTSYALYGQGTYDFSDRLRLTFGARYTIDEKDYRAQSVDCGGDRAGTQFENFPLCQGLGGSLNIIAESFDVSASDDWNDFSPKIALQYDVTDDAMVFGSLSRGYKSGGFGGSQGIASAAIRPVDQETAINLEVGYKGDLLDNTLRLNVTAFATDYDDLQIVRFGPVPESEFGTFITTNIGSADIRGLETELTWNASENLQIAGNLALLDTEVNDIVINNTDVSGSELRQAPDVSYTLMANYNLPTQTGDWDFRVQFSHTDEQINDYIDQRTRVDAFDLLDARVAWTSTDETWEVVLWGQNLTDDDYISHSYVIGPGVIGVWGAPRTFGLTVNYGF
ncbi:MAG: TonB-dependent receptor [Pseudomonadota bacterium]